MVKIFMSLSVWRVWIEIIKNRSIGGSLLSLSVWRVWIEIFSPSFSPSSIVSLSVWRVWIEINGKVDEINTVAVTLCMESVD